MQPATNGHVHSAPVTTTGLVPSRHSSTIYVHIDGSISTMSCVYMSPHNAKVYDRWFWHAHSTVSGFLCKSLTELNFTVVIYTVYINAYGIDRASSTL